MILAASTWNRASGEGLQDVGLDLLQTSIGLVDLVHLATQTSQQLLLLDTVANHELQIVIVPGLFHILEQTDFVDRLDGILFVGVPRQDDPRRCVNATSR